MTYLDYKGKDYEQGVQVQRPPWVVGKGLGWRGWDKKPVRNKHEPTYPPLEMENTTGRIKRCQVFTSEVSALQVKT